jgi:hypothetical protein
MTRPHHRLVPPQQVVLAQPPRQLQLALVALRRRVGAGGGVRGQVMEPRARPCGRRAPGLPSPRLRVLQTTSTHQRLLERGGQLAGADLDGPGILFLGCGGLEWGVRGSGTVLALGRVGGQAPGLRISPRPSPPRPLTLKSTQAPRLPGTSRFMRPHRSFQSLGMIWGQGVGRGWGGVGGWGGFPPQKPLAEVPGLMSSGAKCRAAHASGGLHPRTLRPKKVPAP